MNIGLLVIATRKYRQFLPRFLESARLNFFPQNTAIHLFSEEPWPGVIWHKCDPLGWPDATLLRYHLFSEASTAYILKDYDYLFYSDVDMRFEEKIGEEILPDFTNGPLVGVQHPGFEPGQGSWEGRSESTAYTPPEKRKIYCAGGFNGGKSHAYLWMCRELAGCIAEDKANYQMAVWHDESHMNRFFADHPPKVLSPLYCSPDEWNVPERKIVALLKDHEAVRA